MSLSPLTPTEQRLFDFITTPKRERPSETLSKVTEFAQELIAKANTPPEVRKELEALTVTSAPPHDLGRVQDLFLAGLIANTEEKNIPWILSETSNPFSDEILRALKGVPPGERKEFAAKIFALTSTGNNNELRLYVWEKILRSSYPSPPVRTPTQTDEAYAAALTLYEEECREIHQTKLEVVQDVLGERFLPHFLSEPMKPIVEAALVTLFQSHREVDWPKVLGEYGIFDPNIPFHAVPQTERANFCAHALLLDMLERRNQAERDVSKLYILDTILRCPPDSEETKKAQTEVVEKVVVEVINAFEVVPNEAQERVVQLLAQELISREGTPPDIAAKLSLPSLGSLNLKQIQDLFCLALIYTTPPERLPSLVGDINRFPPTLAAALGAFPPSKRLALLTEIIPKIKNASREEGDLEITQFFFEKLATSTLPAGVPPQEYEAMTQTKVQLANGFLNNLHFNPRLALSRDLDATLAQALSALPPEERARESTQITQAIALAAERHLNNFSQNPGTANEYGLDFVRRCIRHAPQAFTPEIRALVDRMQEERRAPPVEALDPDVMRARALPLPKIPTLLESLEEPQDPH